MKRAKRDLSEGINASGGLPALDCPVSNDDVSVTSMTEIRPDIRIEPQYIHCDSIAIILRGKRRKNSLLMDENEKS
jgi:hypothetical protein